MRPDWPSRSRRSARRLPRPASRGQNAQVTSPVAPSVSAPRTSGFENQTTTLAQPGIQNQVSRDILNDVRRDVVGRVGVAAKGERAGVAGARDRGHAVRDRQLPGPVDRHDVADGDLGRRDLVHDGQRSRRDRRLHRPGLEHDQRHVEEHGGDHDDDADRPADRREPEQHLAERPGGRAALRCSGGWASGSSS